MGAISVLSPWGILIVKGSQLTSNAIPVIAVLFLFLLTAAILPLLKMLGRAWAFSRAELIAVYAMMLVGSVVVTTGFTGSFLSVITGAAYYATPENAWQELFVEHIHPYLAPADADAVRLFYEGLPERGAPVPWAAWARPLAAWMLFIFAFYWVIFCLGALLRGQWIANERLVFPLTRLPLAMLEGADSAPLLGGLFKRRLLWLGAAVPLLLHSWNSLHYYHDAFQPIALTGAVSLLQGSASLPLRVNLPVMGLAYLMALDVSFSIWFFFLLYTLQKVAFARLGFQLGGADIWTSGGPVPVSYQQAGGLFALALFVVWTARSHLRGLWRQARKGEPAPGELVSPRTAFVGLGVGIAVMAAWLTLTGLSVYVALLLIAGALVVFVALSRIVCEAGIPGCQTPMAPQAFITRGFGPEGLGLGNMTSLGLSTVWMGETAANMMNAVMHSLKLTSGDSPAPRWLPWALFAAIAVGLLGSIWFTMTLAYTYGGINLHSWYFSGAPRWPFTYMASMYHNPDPSFGPRLLFTSIGGSVMAGLLFLRHRFVWWPLHPLGFPIASTYTIISYGWFAIFCAWLLKATILRYGGVRAYRALLPFFLGLILGEFTTAGLWLFIDGAYGVEGNMIFNF